MSGNGKDYLFLNLVQEIKSKKIGYSLKILNTVSADELKEFADNLKNDSMPTMCLVNLRIQKDVSWFVSSIQELQIKRGHTFVSFINSYVGDIYGALQDTQRATTHSLVILQRVSYEDALHIIAQLSERFGFYPSLEQKQDIYKWSYGHVGMLRTLYLLKRLTPEDTFTQESLLREPSVLERLNNILHDLPQHDFSKIQTGSLPFIKDAFYKELGYVSADGSLFHPLLLSLIPKRAVESSIGLSPTELRVLNYLQIHPGKTVLRTEIARLVWGEEEWEDKYSDWAISQLIYRLRNKLANVSPADRIRTLKGQGFVLNSAKS